MSSKLTEEELELLADNCSKNAHNSKEISRIKRIKRVGMAALSVSILLTGIKSNAAVLTNDDTIKIEEKGLKDSDIKDLTNDNIETAIGISNKIEEDLKIESKIDEIEKKYEATQNEEIEEVLGLSDQDAWIRLTNDVLDSRPKDKAPENGSEIQDAVQPKIKPITVKIRTWKNSEGMEKEDKEIKLNVNEELEEVWKNFFDDIYNEAPDFVINELYGYRIDAIGKNQVGALSAHNYGAAVDINASQNYANKQPLTKEEWEKLPETREKYEQIYQGSKVIDIAHRYTLSWGGEWINLKDPMHISFFSDYNRDELKNRFSGERKEYLEEQKKEFFDKAKEELLNWAKKEDIQDYNKILNGLDDIKNGRDESKTNPSKNIKEGGMDERE